MEKGVLRGTETETRGERSQVLLEPGPVLRVLRGMARGLGYLHACRPPMVHGDVRAANILVRSVLRMHTPCKRN
jgi:hypothetical protein